MSRKPEHSSRSFDNTNRPPGRDSRAQRPPAETLANMRARYMRFSGPVPEITQPSAPQWELRDQPTSPQYPGHLADTSNPTLARSFDNTNRPPGRDSRAQRPPAETLANMRARYMRFSGPVPEITQPSAPQWELRDQPTSPQYPGHLADPFHLSNPTQAGRRPGDWSTQAKPFSEAQLSQLREIYGGDADPSSAQDGVNRPYSDSERASLAISASHLDITPTGIESNDEEEKMEARLRAMGKLCEEIQGKKEKVEDIMRGVEDITQNIHVAEYPRFNRRIINAIGALKEERKRVAAIHRISRLAYKYDNQDSLIEKNIKEELKNGINTFEGQFKSAFSKLRAGDAPTLKDIAKEYPLELDAELGEHKAIKARHAASGGAAPSRMGQPDLYSTGDPQIANTWTNPPLPYNTDWTGLQSSSMAERPSGTSDRRGLNPEGTVFPLGTSRPSGSDFGVSAGILSKDVESLNIGGGPAEGSKRVETTVDESREGKRIYAMERLSEEAANMYTSINNITRGRMSRAGKIRAMNTIRTRLAKIADIRETFYMHLANSKHPDYKRQRESAVNLRNSINYRDKQSQTVLGRVLGEGSSPLDKIPKSYSIEDDSEFCEHRAIAAEHGEW